MTGGFLSVPIMPPHQRWTVLHVSILAGLLLISNADSEDSKCEVEVKVRRNTVYEVSLGEDLWINCTVTFCDDPPPTVSWYNRGLPVNLSSSSHVKIKWESLNRLEGTWFLIFQKILRNDSGQYQCQGGDSVSHYINVTVRGDGRRSNVIRKNDTTGSTILPPERTEDLWMYMYLVAGIVALVGAVIVVSIVSMRGCKGKPKKETQTENQCIAIPMVEQPFPRAGLRASPRGSPSAAPCRRKTPPSQPNESPSPRHNERVRRDMKGDRERGGGTMEEEGSSIVYAALNHQHPAGGAARPQRPKEESSEYAAIRVKDPSPVGLRDFKVDNFPH